MANKPLQSIKFPGLSDTYTVPQVDNTLTATGAAADAKKVGDEITNLKDDLRSRRCVLGFFQESLFEKGSIGSNGQDDTFHASSRIRTPILSLDSDYEIRYNGGAERFIVYYFDQYGNYVSDTGWTSRKRIEKNSFVRVLMTNDPASTETKSVGDILNLFIVAPMDSLDGYNLSNYRHGCLLSDGTEIYNTYNANNRAISIRTELNPYDITIVPDGGKYYIFTYDLEGNFVESIGGNAWLTSEFTIPKNTPYRLMLTINDTPATISDILSHFQFIVGDIHQINEDISQLTITSRSIIDDLSQLNSTNLLKNLTHLNKTHNNVTWTWDGNKCTVSGTASAIENNDFFSAPNSFPINFIVGNTYNIEYSSQNINLIIYAYVNGTASLIISTKTNGEFTIPADATGLIIRLNIPKDTTVNEVISPSISSTKSNSMLEHITESTAYGKLNIFDYEHGSLNNGVNDSYRYNARARTKQIMMFPYPVRINTNGGRFIAFTFSDDETTVSSSSGWTSDEYIIKANTKFRLLLTPNEQYTQYFYLGDILDMFSISPFYSKYENIEKGNINNGQNDGYHTVSRCRTISIINNDFDTEIVANGGAFKISMYNDDETWLLDTKWQYNSYVIPANTKYRVVYTLDPFSTELNSIDDIMEAFAINQIKRYEKQTQLLLPLKRHFNTDESTKGTWANRNNNNLFTLAHISDVHCDVVRYKHFYNYISKNAQFISASIQTGDLIDAPSEEQISIMHAVDPENSILFVAGNHDISGNDGTTTFKINLADLYNAFDLNTNTGLLYYYKDYTDKGIRLIVLNSYNSDGYTAIFNYKAVQMNWFINTLRDAATNDLAVLVAMHTQESEITENDKGFYARFYQWEGLEVNPNYFTVEKIIDAFKKGISTTVSFYNESVTADFTGNAGMFIAYLTGHRHSDRIGYSENYPDQLYLCITCGALNQNFGRKLQDFTDVSDIPRVEGTDTENAFNIYTFDLDNRIVKVLRIGSDVNDLMEDRKTAVFTF